MKKTILSAAVLLAISLATMAQDLKTPEASTTQTIQQNFALSYIELVYSRPNMKGRKIFGDLVPFGKPWRTGANNATKITFGEDVKVAGQAVKAGSYALYTIPGQAEWEVILNKGIGNWGVFGYNEADNVARFKVKPIEMPFGTETFTMQIGDITDNSANIMLWWENTAVIFGVTAEIDSKIMSNIDKIMNTDSKPYFEAATYYYENGKDLTKALAWANKAIDQYPNAYWVILLKARIQAKMGDKAGAKATSLKSQELAKAQGNPDYVALNQKLLDSLK
jgi:hypothetical protein